MNKESSADFYKVLNDDVLIDNIETNILKNIIADNEARDLRALRDKIQRAYCSTDMVGYNKDPSKMRSLAKKEGYTKYFKVVPAKKWWRIK
jgi:hypothetical protein